MLKLLQNKGAGLTIIVVVNFSLTCFADVTIMQKPADVPIISLPSNILQGFLHDANQQVHITYYY